MKDFKKHYKERLVSAKEAVSKIKDNNTVVVSHAVCEPTYLIDEMVANYKDYKNVELVHMIGMGKQEYCKPGFEGHLRYNSIFVGGIARDAIFEGRADYTPCYFSKIPYLFYDGYIPVDVFLVQLSPPDKHGYCSMGLSIDYGYAASKCAKMIIAQINEEMPRSHGDSFIHVNDIDYFVEHNAPIIELFPPKLTEVDIKIGQNCASLVKDGDTLQLGIGSLPDAVLLGLKEKKDLGIHTEMISDGILELIDLGVVNNKKKTLHKDKSVVSFIMGTRKLYDIVDDNPSFALMPVEYVNDPNVIAKNDNMVSINSCVQVDLLGQVCSESVGLKQISSVGGQVDFVRGANMSKGGRSIIALPSTAKGGTLSKIVPFLDEGAVVTTPRNDVSYIITEYGVAFLPGKTLKDKARALIEIAHPNFRDELKEEWERRYKMKY